MKKNYQKPSMRVVRIQQNCMICAGSSGKATSVSGNVFNNSITGGSDEARSRTVNWDDEE